MRPYANAWRSGPDHHDSWTSTSVVIEFNHNRGQYAGAYETMTVCSSGHDE